MPCSALHYLQMQIQLHLVLFSQDCNLALQSHGFSHLLTLVHVFRVSYLFHIRNELPAQSQRTKQPEYLYFLKCYLQHLFRLVLNLIRLLGNLLHRIILQVAPLKVAFFQMFLIRMYYRKQLQVGTSITESSSGS
ncbi:Uncharacterised protein [Streptococcus pneumoniae]|nr:Uncharacterised protein [Streptococcus pneumoniae]